MVKSAPLAARKHAIDALDFLSAPGVPRPISNWNDNVILRQPGQHNSLQCSMLFHRLCCQYYNVGIVTYTTSTDDYTTISFTVIGM